MATKMNKKASTIRIMQCGEILPCRKEPIANIVLPKWSDIGLLGMMFRQCLSTKEQPDGNIYDEARFQTVLRVIRGKVLMENRPDCYAWKFQKLETAQDVRPIGTNCADAIINLHKLFCEIPSEEEQTLLADMLAKWNDDLLLVTLPAEERSCIEVTQKLFDMGITSCVDEWMEEDENGDAEVTMLNVGDFLIVSENGVYCIRHDEFVATHVLL